MIFISSSTPLTSNDHAGLVVRVTVKRKIEPPSDDDENPSQETPSGSPGTTNTEDLKERGFFTVYLCLVYTDLYAGSTRHDRNVGREASCISRCGRS